MTPTLDYNGFPNIIDIIIGFAPHKALLALRATCRDIKNKVDPILHRHIRLGRRQDDHSQWRVWGTAIWLDDDTLNTNARILDMQEADFFKDDAIVDDINDGRFGNTHLVRVLPIPEHELGDKEDGTVDIDLKVPNSAVVAFIECHRSLPPVIRFWGDMDMVVVALMYHPNWFDGPFGHSCFIPDFNEADYDKDVYLLLVPDGEPWSHGDPAKAEVAGILTKLLLEVVDKLHYHIKENQRITFVGAESWDHRWLDRRIKLLGWDSDSDNDSDWGSGSNGDAGLQSMTLKEMCEPGASVADRFQWWINKVANIHLLGDEHEGEDLSMRVSFMTMKEFKAKLGNEVAELIISPYKSRD
ncbi:hypothetical protein CcaverHIS002_0202340 [Cutaneotrichosporon cavernicola]|uniref:Uncharacterized protein n=1 Tax=Cutaneotrichosporon cavernicola TaxID=279322 RepID=A0AA48IF37_9TREE|nr:uncharacterized protein CcaverHIS019_0202350 [Cutaneotrichosporon cavernicola]BEI81074.1 hypothetical protein CcaverHIS002_0202340 [Cutaneotrichosporon cavernicola]BEI88873.1 hypothetical protein CcaverHIS019_0202350 [Cutaneotrichosporon cavernicola]BEI96650.1 hypothetical protein CcaverHIS631_0202390 [Cutaneotrichosporon cavernicola]BEJ04422.1 hypothetical protein CcaverHIS641_0202390 [Cutaneotrichosporon cavernicola]